MLTFGQGISLWRTYRGLSQARLAELTRIPRPNLSRIESDRHDVSLKTVRALALALGVSPGALVDGRLPQERPAKKLSRADLERLARKIAANEPLNDPEEEALAQNVRAVIGPRLRALGVQDRPISRIGRRANRAWMSLSRLSPEERDSLIQRAIEHATRLKP